MRKFLKWLAPKSFNDGLESCNRLGKRLITRVEVDRFLDAGCGDGKLTMQFAEIILPKEVFGIELADELRHVAESKGIKCAKQDLNARWNFDDDFFDVILSSQSIEHLHNTRLNLEECLRCLKPAGQLIVLTENLAS